MLRRVRDALLLNVAVVYAHHLGVLAVRYGLSRRSLGSPESVEAACSLLRN